MNVLKTSNLYRASNTIWSNLSLQQSRNFSLMTNTAIGRTAMTNQVGNSNSNNTINSPLLNNSPIFLSVAGLIQRRFKSRGNTYQPSTYRRKSTFGFLARLRAKNGKKVLQRRRAKGRWYLTH